MLIKMTFYFHITISQMTKFRGKNCVFPILNILKRAIYNVDFYVTRVTVSSIRLFVIIISFP